MNTQHSRLPARSAYHANLSQKRPQSHANGLLAFVWYLYTFFGQRCSLGLFLRNLGASGG